MRNWGAGELPGSKVGRRAILAGALAGGLLLLPGCASIEPFSYDAAVRRLLTHATQDAFAQLVAPDGFWDSSVARINLPVLFGKRGTAMEGILKSPQMREKLQHQLNRFAEDGARKAAPLVADAIRTVGIENAAAIITGEPSAATTFLRDAMGVSLVNAMIPELERVMSVAQDPLLNQAISVLSGVDMADAAHALALEADNAIWYEVGAAEARIRANPQASNDPILIRAFAGG